MTAVPLLPSVGNGSTTLRSRFYRIYKQSKLSSERNPKIKDEPGESAAAFMLEI